MCFLTQLLAPVYHQVNYDSCSADARKRRNSILLFALLLFRFYLGHGSWCDWSGSLDSHVLDDFDDFRLAFSVIGLV